jgi:poly(A) polymerase
MTSRKVRPTRARSEIATLTRIRPTAWMVEPATGAVLTALAAGGADARFVGGAVRDALLDRWTATDIDIATPAPPERVMVLLREAGIRTVPTGLAHGTVTAIVPPRHFEITTLRRDVETFGRHARVAFDADWASDAARRDFTINAIFLDPDGTLHDPVGGLADLSHCRVRFVGDPATRIAEDVLRLLRYYRFEARFGTGEGDAEARAACRAAAPLLPTLSAERVALELTRLIESRQPAAALQMMDEDRVLLVVLPEARRLDRLGRMIAIEPAPDPLRRFAALVEVDAPAAAALASRLRFSNAWRDRLQRLAAPWPLDPAGDRRAQRLACYRLGAETYRDLALLLAADGAIDRTRLAELLRFAENGPPAFPLGGSDVVALGIAPGEVVGRLLGAVRGWWEASDFTADRAQCLAQLRQIVPAAPDSAGGRSDANR